MIGFLDRRLRDIEASTSSRGDPLENGIGLPIPETNGSQLDLSSAPRSTTITSTVDASRRASHAPSLPWRMLASDTATSSSLLEQANSLAEEETVLPLSANPLAYNFRQDFPLLSGEDVIQMARAFAFEAPFAFVHWPTLKAEIMTLIDQHVSTTAAHLACIFMVC